MNIRYRVDLDAAERAELTGLLTGGRWAVRTLKRADPVGRRRRRVGSR